MSDKICPICNSEINENSKFCPECGCPLENRDENIEQDKKQDFFSFTEDIASKIQNKLDNEDIFNTNEIKEMIKNLDEDSINKLLNKYGISPSRIKVLTLNKLFDKVDISKLKEDLIEFGIINPESDIKNVKTEIIIEDEEKPEEEVIEDETLGSVEEENVEDGVEEVIEDETSSVEETAKPEGEEHSKISNICIKCGFENRPNVKFCTKCGNKLI